MARILRRALGCLVSAAANRVPVLALLAGTLVASGLSSTALAQSEDPYQGPPIHYNETAPKDVIARLEARLRSGGVRFHGADRDILRQLLSNLGIPESSQILVFAKTSFQRDRISPTNPRAIYFSDDCYIGWVPGGLMEVASMDPHLGAVFYAFDPHATDSKASPFVRDPDCLRCHGGTFVRGIPGILARSVPTDAGGEPLLQFGSLVVDQTTPFEDRWGGWYVTGHHGDSVHRGNVFAREDRGELKVRFDLGSNRTNLPPEAEPARYPVQSSDIAALLVFEHQLTVQNAMTRAMIQCRRMLYYQQGLQRDLNEPVAAEPTYPSTRNVFDHSAQEILDALLFKGEAPLPDCGIQASPAFVRDYEATGPRTREGRSLRDLDLRHRLLRHRCSPLIYSECFRLLPLPLRTRVLTRLHRVLEFIDAEPRYGHLTPAERRLTHGILMETHPEYAAATR